MKPAASPNARQRRVLDSDRESLKSELEFAAFTLFLTGGAKAVSLRAIALAVGVSAMTPYGYFPSKADLLASLWPHILGNMFDKLEPIFDLDCPGMDKQRLICLAVLNYWESNPEHYRIVYMTEGVSNTASLDQRVKVPQYKASLEKNLSITVKLAEEIDGDPSKAAMANDMRFAMLLGFTHASIVTKHYPWTDRDSLKQLYVDHVVRSVADLLGSKPKVR